MFLTAFSGIFRRKARVTRPAWWSPPSLECSAVNRGGLSRKGGDFCHAILRPKPRRPLSGVILIGVTPQPRADLAARPGAAPREKGFQKEFGENNCPDFFRCPDLLYPVRGLSERSLV